MDLTTLQEIALAAISVVGALLTGIATVGAGRLVELVGIERNGGLEEYIEKLMTQGLHALEASTKDAIRAGDAKIENETASEIVDWAWKMAPDFLERLGMDEVWLREKARTLAREVL